MKRPSQVPWELRIDAAELCLCPDCIRRQPARAALLGKQFSRYARKRIGAMRTPAGAP